MAEKIAAFHERGPAIAVLGEGENEMATSGELTVKSNGNGKLQMVSLAISAGAGVGLMHIVYLAMKSDPKSVLNLASNWGPVFFMALAIIWVGDRRIGELIATTRENVAAQQRMADAMQTIAQKDDERAREQDLLIGELTRNSRTTLEHIAEIEKHLRGRADGPR